MTDSQMISWYEHRGKTGALEDEIELLRRQKLEWNTRAVQERERRNELRDAARRVVNQDRSTDAGEADFEDALHRLWLLVTQEAAS